MRFTAVLLAGGQSTRMGADKAFVRLAGKPLVEWVLDALEPLTRSFVIVANDLPKFAAYESRARVVADDPPRAGPLAALRAGLRNSRQDWVFVTSCDAPFLQPAFVQALARFTRGADAAVPGSPEERWPLTAFYHQRCMPALDRAVQRDDKKIIAFFPDVAVRWVPLDELRRWDPELRSLWNVNSPTELEKAEALLAKASRAG
ncbi:MAG TPA: molybdenum cofactor guanylyltransferase [Candidatus Thermoplasmatota archaeon]|nr:molybdenum cofactor guanylyltransferase [Candidatus Thermoplasmatota archaeon]